MGAKKPAAAVAKNSNFLPGKTKQTIIENEKTSKWWFLLVFIIATVLAIVHARHVATMFENDRHFSHLGDIEREMTYRTEMGLYYSYYKTLIESPSLFNGLYQITNDNVTEYGHTINTLKRFTLYPEVILAAMYRPFKQLANWGKWRVQTCWQVNRGNELPPIESCEGLGNPHYFYVNHVFGLAGTVASSIFILGTILGDSLLGGVLAVAAFAFNHGEATRVQWTPPLRESFGYPIFIAQLAAVTFVIKNRRDGNFWSGIIAVLTTTFMLVWQFSQFALFTQIVAIFVTFSLDFISPSIMWTILKGHLIAFFTGFALLFGNEMLLTSLHLSSLMTAIVILSLHRPLSMVSFRPIYLLLSNALFIGGTLGVKLAMGKILRIEDDAINKLSATFLLPCAALGAAIVVYAILKYDGNSTVLWRPKTQNGLYPELAYSIIQLFIFTVMALLIMRLKLFWTPQLCVTAAILANHKLITQIRPVRWLIHQAMLIAIIAAMGYRGYANIEQQYAIKGEYSNPEQEMLFRWIMDNAVFAGTMPVMANVKLTTGRPIVNHPHYEDVGIRERTLKVYSLFSKKPILEVHDMLKAMGVEYFVYQQGWCSINNQRPECSYRSMWDLEDPTNRHRQSLCDLVSEAISGHNADALRPFKIVYNARNYIVFSL